MNSNNSSNEKNEFLQAMQGVKRLKNERYNVKAQVKKKPAYFKHHRETENIPDHLSDQWEFEPVGYEEIIKFSRDGISYKQVHQLKTGNILVEDHLDLHGLSIQESRQLLLNFYILPK